MTAPQIAELVLDLYTARSEAKEYLDFFVSPDIDKQLDKARAAIVKECTRISRGRNRARSTRIRRHIRDIASLNPGEEHVAEIMTFAMETMCDVACRQFITPVTQGGIARLLHDTIIYCDTYGLASRFIPRLEQAVDSMKSSWWRGNEFKKLLAEVFNDTLQSLASATDMSMKKPKR